MDKDQKGDDYEETIKLYAQEVDRLRFQISLRDKQIKILRGVIKEQVMKYNEQEHLLQNIIQTMTEIRCDIKDIKEHVLNKHSPENRKSFLEKIKIFRKRGNQTPSEIADDANRSTYYQRTRQQQSRPTNIVPALNGHGDPSCSIKNITPTPSTPTVASVAARQQQIQQQQQQQQAAMAAQGGAGRGLRSNVVKEVERLKKNREERSQRKADLKEEKDVLMSMDPGNPNWEFLAMIREYRNGIKFRPLRETDPVEDHQITVCIRKRPLNKKEVARKEVDVISVPNKDQIVVHHS